MPSSALGRLGTGIPEAIFGRVDRAGHTDFGRQVGAAVTGQGVYCWGENATQAREEPGSPLGHLRVIGDGRWQGDLILGGSKGAW